MRPFDLTDRGSPDLIWRNLSVPVLIGFVGCAGCQSVSPASGYLSRYDSQTHSEQLIGAAREQWRDDAGSDGIEHVYIQPAVLALGPQPALSPDEQARVQREVDKQVCFKISKRFIVEPAPSPRAGTIRTAIVRIRPTGRISSAVSAAVGFAIPIPLVKFRAPMTTGGLAVETELLAPDGTQVAALRWSRTAEVVTRLEPSLSRVGDALQLAGPLGDAMGDAFATKARKKTSKIADPDPCARFGPRRDVGRIVAGGLMGAGTGLYMPEVSGAGSSPKPAAATGSQERSN